MLSESVLANPLGALRLTHEVPGSPYQPGERVLVVRAIDRYVHDVSEFVGKAGVVLHLERVRSRRALLGARSCSRWLR